MFGGLEKEGMGFGKKKRKTKQKKEKKLIAAKSGLVEIKEYLKRYK